MGVVYILPFQLNNVGHPKRRVQADNDEQIISAVWPGHPIVILEMCQVFFVSDRLCCVHFFLLLHTVGGACGTGLMGCCFVA